MTTRSDILYSLLEYAEYEIDKRTKLVMDIEGDAKLLYVVTDSLFRTTKKPIGIVTAIKKYGINYKDPALNQFLDSFKEEFIRESGGGSCYQDSFESLGKFEGWKLVHGIAINTGKDHEGKEFGHSWLEKDEIVYDAASGKTVPRELFYRVGQIKYTVEYTEEEARKNAVKFRHYGPWDKKIKATLHS
jgi:hypothetical protein